MVCCMNMLLFVIRAWQDFMFQLSQRIPISCVFVLNSSEKTISRKDLAEIALLVFANPEIKYHGVEHT